jgi:hypothetical protein
VPAAERGCRPNDGGRLFARLEELLGTPEFEEAGWITIARVDNRPPGMRLLLDVRSDAEGFERQAWSLTCADLRGDAELVLLAPDDYLIGAGFDARRVPVESLPSDV